MLIVWILVSLLYYETLDIYDDMFIIGEKYVYSPSTNKNYSLYTQPNYIKRGNTRNMNQTTHMMITYEYSTSETRIWRPKRPQDGRDYLFFTDPGVIISVPIERVVNVAKYYITTPTPIPVPTPAATHTPIPLPTPVPAPTPLPIIIPCNTHKNNYPFIIKSFILNTIFE